MWIRGYTSTTPQKACEAACGEPYLVKGHLLQLLLPCWGVSMVIVGGRGELAEDAGVAVVAQVGQVGDVELEFTAVLGEG